MVGELGAEAQPGLGVGDERFWVLYRAGLPHVFGFFARRCDRATAEDLTQEVFVDLARRARSGGIDDLNVGWLLSVARSRFVDHLRARERADRNLRLAWSAASVDERSGVVDSVHADHALAPAAERALEALGALQRGVLVLHHVDGYSVAEVAKAIGRSVRATESMLARARRSFRDAFEEEETDA